MTNGNSTRIQASVPRTTRLWWRAACVEHVKLACPPGKARMTLASRSVPKAGSLSMTATARSGSSANTKRAMTVG